MPRVPSPPASWRVTLASWIAASLLAACSDPERASDRLPEIRPELHAAHLPVEACAPCHPRHVAEYAASPMAYAESSPVFRALERALNEIGAEAHPRGLAPFGGEIEGPGRDLCVRCHAPDRDEGITCDFCHRVTGPDLDVSPLGDGIANAALTASPGPTKHGPFSEAVPNAFHHSARGEAGAYLSSAAFCGACHDVRLPIEDVTRREVDQGGHPMGRLENLFTEWSQSPWAQPDHPKNPMRGVRGIGGLPGGAPPAEAGEQITCQDCHMSLYPYRGLADAVTYDEHFAGVDAASLTRKAHKLYPAAPAATAEGAVGPTPRRRASIHDFTAVSNPVVPFPEGEDRRGLWGACPQDAWGRPTCTEQRRVDMLRAAVALDLTDIPEEGRAGELISLPIWLENVGAGHNVPAGFSQEREVWVSIRVYDEGRPCREDVECLDLVQPRRFVDDHDPPCEVTTPTGALDPVITSPAQAGGLTRELRARRERSGLCDQEIGRCVVYRSGYLVDLDGDGLTDDEDLRHALVALEPDHLEERCVLPGPDADLRPLGVNEGLVWFTNAFHDVALDEAGEPVLSDRDWELEPEGEGPEHATERALWGRHRYLGAQLRDPATGEALPRARRLEVAHPLAANRFFDGSALRPFEPRLARYDVRLPANTEGPLSVKVRLRYRFFPPRLIRALAWRHRGSGSTEEGVTEAMLDESVLTVDIATGERQIRVLPVR